MNKVVLIGCGNVGMSYALSLVYGNSYVDELVLIDINKNKAYGEALDLEHASSCSEHKIIIKAGDYNDCNDADIICIAAGRNQEVGETRNELIDKNVSVFRLIIDEINKTNFNGIYLIATNPLDIMTYITLKLSNTESTKVIGSGTTLDTARLRYIISKELSINPRNIHAYVIGEHGDSEIIPWSNALIGLNPLIKFINKRTRNRILKEVRNSAYEIIKNKGNTAYGIGMCLKNLTDAIFSNSNSIFTVSVYNPKLNICIGQPTIINRNGVNKIMELNLNKEEKQEFLTSVNTIKNLIASLNL